MSNSSLISSSVLTDNYGYRNGWEIDTLTIHYMCWYTDGETCAESFVPSSRQASATYCIGKYGDIVLNVPEEYRPWTTGSTANDRRAVTIECANYMEDADGHVDGQLPDATWDALVRLCADVCERNGKTRLVYRGSADYDGLADTDMLLTKHKWFQATDCPGPWLDLQFDRLADEVNERLGIHVPDELHGWAHSLEDCRDASDYAYCTCAVYSTGYSQQDRENISIQRLKDGTAETDCSYGVNAWLYWGGLLDELIGFWTAIEIDYLVSKGFALLPATVAPRRNDVLWRSGHTALYIGDGMQAEALWSEDHSYDGAPGDQTGGETLVREYPAGGWTYILRPPAKEEIEETGDGMLACIVEIEDEHSGYKAGARVLWTAEAGFEYINHPDSIKLLDDMSTYYTGKPLFRVKSSTKGPWIERLAQITINDKTKGVVK